MLFVWVGVGNNCWHKPSCINRACRSQQVRQRESGIDLGGAFLQQRRGSNVEGCMLVVRHWAPSVPEFNQRNGAAASQQKSFICLPHYLLVVSLP
jgi:hypothetical protein